MPTTRKFGSKGRKAYPEVRNGGKKYLTGRKETKEIVSIGGKNERKGAGEEMNTTHEEEEYLLRYHPEDENRGGYPRKVKKPMKFKRRK